MTNNSNTNSFLDRAVNDLKTVRDQATAASEELAQVKNKIALCLKQSGLDYELEQANNQVEVAKAAALEQDAVVRAEAMRVYELTANKTPHPAIVVKEFSVLSYDVDKALDYAREHLPACVKLDTKAFEKVAKALPLDFVTESKEPRVTIATNLEGKV
jgi:hypothetical protein